MSLPTTKKDIVLVVDDSPDALSLLHDVLEMANMDVLVALEGQQALTIAQKIRPDIILLDAIMPNLDGFDTCKALKSDPNLASIPVIFMTGLSDTDDIVRGLDAGGVDYLTKPIQTDELLARMRVHLSNARLHNSTQSALDRVGQNLITVTPMGRLVWATPQTYALLAKANINHEWQNTQLIEQIRLWLTHQPNIGNTLKPTGLLYPLELKLIGYTGQKEALLKLEDGNKPQGSALLKAQLKLTERESEVLYWIANGKTNREIADILAMSPRTVNKHLEQIFPKLNVDNRTSAAATALKVFATEQRTWP